MPSTLMHPIAMSQHETAADGAQGAGTDAGPPSELPDPVPDFVSDIHSKINDFIGGGVENLGEAVSGIASSGGGEAAAMAADVAMIIPF
jgi:hypothetical protein